MRDVEAVSLAPRESRSSFQPPAGCDPRGRRRARAQAQRREAEQCTREFIAEIARDCRPWGLSVTEVARHLKMPARTVRHWKSEACQVRPICRRGRPPQTCSVADRNEVFHFLREVSGPAVGVEALRALFPTVPRCVIADLLRRYRRVWRYRERRSGFRLNWLRPGSVWAIDFSEPRHPIDGVHDYLFAVRDLASHCQLAWHPFRGETAAEAIEVMEDLFRRHGPPLVLKSDNGSAFIAELFRDMLRACKRPADCVPVSRPGGARPVDQRADEDGTPRRVPRAGRESQRSGRGSRLPAVGQQ